MVSPVEQIKDRLSIADVIASYAKLEPAGKNFKARCPFHNERTPSFFVSPERQNYHCFGCGKGGDIFSFVEEAEGLDFKGALKVLADRAGIPLPTFSKAALEEHDRLHALMDEAARLYEGILQKYPDVLFYLKDRGLADDTIRDWRVGFVQNDWRTATAHLLGLGYTYEEMIRAGLAIPNNHGAYDRFRGRIMFPITDAAGRVIAFSGRIWGKEREEEGKYINSPETPLYEKSRVLFGFDKAKHHIRKAQACVVVEGQMDALLSHHAGVPHTVAVSGTALTVHHLSLIKRFTDRLIFAFDRDSAGLAAAGRAIELALSRGFAVLIAKLPAEKDPADVAKASPENWRALTEHALPAVDFYLDLYKDRRLEGRELTSSVKKELLPLVARIENAIERAQCVGKIANALQVGESAVWEEIAKVKPPESLATASTASQKEKEKEQAQHPAETLREKVEHRMAGLYLWQKNAAARTLAMNAAEQMFLAMNGSPFSAILERRPDDSLPRAVFEAEMYYSGGTDLVEEWSNLSSTWKEQTLRSELLALSEVVARAEKTSDSALLEQATERFTQLSRELAAFQSQ